MKHRNRCFFQPGYSNLESIFPLTIMCNFTNVYSQVILTLKVCFLKTLCAILSNILSYAI